MTRTSLVALLLLELLPSVVFAQSTNEIFGSVEAVTEWFSKLNAQFDAAVKAESRAQLQRSVDRLRKDLYTLEADARVLMENVPDQAPSAEQRDRLDQLAQELQATVRRLTQNARAVGADLRLNEAERVEAALTSGLRTRGIVLEEFRRALLPPATAAWNGAAIRSRLSDGVEAVRQAQLAVTDFSRKLSAAQ
jgi:hypothetical protein